MAAPAHPNVVLALEATVHQVLDKLASELRELGLTQGEINALAQLKPGVTRTVAELQAATGQRASTLTGVLDRLERRGLIERQLNPRDRRSFTLQLTDAGADVAAEVMTTLRRLHRRVLRAIPRESAQGFYDVLAALDAVARI
jgi:MarR family transcriptional regulator, organic hydroperoxide resistance regulator